MSSLFFSPLLRRPQKEMRQLSGPGVHGPLSKTQWCVHMREQNPQVPLLMDAVPSALSKPCHALPAFHPAFTQLPFCGEHSKGGQGHVKLTKHRWTWALVPWSEVYLGNAARCKPPREWGNHLPNSISFRGFPAGQIQSRWIVFTTQEHIELLQEILPMSLFPSTSPTRGFVWIHRQGQLKRRESN